MVVLFPGTKAPRREGDRLKKEKTSSFQDIFQIFPDFFQTKISSTSNHSPQHFCIKPAFSSGKTSSVKMSWPTLFSNFCCCGKLLKVTNRVLQITFSQPSCSLLTQQRSWSNHSSQEHSPARREGQAIWSGDYNIFQAGWVILWDTQPTYKQLFLTLFFNLSSFSR